jgi:hypothetical protein
VAKKEDLVLQQDPGPHSKILLKVHTPTLEVRRTLGAQALFPLYQLFPGLETI